MSNQIKTVSAAAISTDGLQVRAAMDRAHIDDIADLFDGENPTWPAELPPIVVFWDGQTYHDADGHHRLAAAIQAGCTEVRVDVRKGTKEDALRYACGANAGHGLKRSHADKNNAVRVMWCLLGKPAIEEKQARRIAKLCNVSNTLVSSVLKKLTPPVNNDNPASGKPARASVNNDSLAESPISEECYADCDPEADADASGGEREPLPSSRHSAGGCPDSQAGTLTLPAPSASASLDALGVPCQSESAVRAFASLDYFEQLESLLTQAARLVNQLGGMAGAELYRANHLRVTSRGGEDRFASNDIENALKELRHWRPYTACPHCLAVPQHDCGCCKGLPYVVESAFLRAPERLRGAVIDLKKQ